MPEEQRLELLEYVKSLNKEFWERGPVKVVEVPPRPQMTAERIANALEPDQTWDLVFYVLSLSKNAPRMTETGR